MDPIVFLGVGGGERAGRIGVSRAGTAVGFTGEQVSLASRAAGDSFKMYVPSH